MHFILKLINRMTRSKRIWRVKSFRSNSKVALVSYVLYLPWMKSQSFYFKINHSNKMACKAMVDSLIELGYDVMLTDCSDDLADVDLADVDLFLGHSTTFEVIAKRLKQDAKKILLLTGGNPDFGNQKQREREEYFFERHGVRIGVFEENIVTWKTNNLEIADRILLMGNENVLMTYNPIFRDKIKLINNLSPFEIHKVNNSKNFLFISSEGQIHRGLDLLLDVFHKRNETLYFCSKYLLETKFFNFYKTLIKSHSNLVGLGFILATDKNICLLAKKARFVILPSCSEGQSSSVINLMRKGLIPIVTENVGLPGNIADYGFVIRQATIEEIDGLLDLVAKLSPEEIESKERELLKICKLFDYDNFKNKMRNEFANV